VIVVGGGGGGVEDAPLRHPGCSLIILDVTWNKIHLSFNWGKVVINRSELMESLLLSLQSLTKSF